MTKLAVNAKTRRQKVVESLQKRVLDGELKPGAPLRQIPLSKEFGVSQSVIRESLQVLQQLGLATSAASLGFVVREFGRQDLIDAYQVREALEGLAARLCCRKASPDDVDQLRQMATAIHDQSGTGTRAERSELEYRFHQRFLEISVNETLQRVSIGYRFAGNLVVTDRDPDQLLQEHLAVVEAVASNRPDEAERVARLHVANSADSIQLQHP